MRATSPRGSRAAAGRIVANVTPSSVPHDPPRLGTVGAQFGHGSWDVARFQWIVYLVLCWSAALGKGASADERALSQLLVWQ
jgi:hypothetical protein